MVPVQSPVRRGVQRNTEEESPRGGAPYEKSVSPEIQTDTTTESIHLRVSNMRAQPTEGVYC